jgi:hypothetical protein
MVCPDVSTSLASESCNETAPVSPFARILARQPDSNGLALTDKTTDVDRRMLSPQRHSPFGRTLIAAVTATALIVVAVAFYAKADISCTRESEEGPMIASTILIFGCASRAVAVDARR